MSPATLDSKRSLAMMNNPTEAATHPLLTNFRRRVPGVVYGCDYNPEQWTSEVWREDVVLMREANVRVVSLGIFAWSALEPADGVFAFEWLDEIIDLLWSHGISVNLATPNASPPPWMAEQFPETLMVERDGTRMSVGSRGHFCPSSPIFLDRSRRIARKLAERYRDHPGLVMWHIGNEFFANCHCDTCDGTFRNWLQRKYKTLDAVNSAWGTSMWGQIYSDWDQVHVPRPVRGSRNPARDLDFTRFSTELQIELYKGERAIFAELTPEVPATTNFVQFQRLQDYRRWAPEMDVIAFDMYPDPAKSTSLIDAALQYDLMRALGKGESWMLMEQAAGAVSQWRLNVVKQPGRLRLGSFQAVAHGADAVMYFQWRASAFGQEKFHSAMLPHGGKATRSWEEVRDLGNELSKIDDVVGGRTRADVAFVWDWENWWAVEGVAHPRNDFDYRAVESAHYQSVWRTNAATDVVSLSDDLSKYRVLVIPNQYLITAGQRRAVRDFAERGGRVLISYFSGIVDENDQVIPGGYPGGLRDVIGAHIRELSPLAESGVEVHMIESNRLIESRQITRGTQWQDDITLEGAEAAAVFAEGYLSGQPAILDHRLGKGRVVYLATTLEQDVLDDVIASVIAEAGVTSPHGAPRGVEVTIRSTSDAEFLFLLNHNVQNATVVMEVDGFDRLTARRVVRGESIELSAGDVMVIEIDQPRS